MGIFFILYNKGCDSMKAYEIKNAMIDTLDIFLESNQDEMDKENYNNVMEYLREELESKRDRKSVV